MRTAGMRASCGSGWRAPGKTTVAINLAVMRSAAGHDVLLVDADNQETSSDFTIRRNERQPHGAGYTSIKLTGPAVRTETLRLADKYGDIIIDTGGRDTTSQLGAGAAPPRDHRVAEACLRPCRPDGMTHTVRLDAGLLARWRAGALRTVVSRPRGFDEIYVAIPAAPPPCAPCGTAALN